jgi:hypothetical protein
MSVIDTGVVRMVELLAEGAATSHANRLSPALGWPVYTPLYGRLSNTWRAGCGLTRLRGTGRGLGGQDAA